MAFLHVCFNWFAHRTGVWVPSIELHINIKFIQSILLFVANISPFFLRHRPVFAFRSNEICNPFIRTIYYSTIHSHTTHTPEPVTFRFVCFFSLFLLLLLHENVILTNVLYPGTSCSKLIQCRWLQKFHTLKTPTPTYTHRTRTRRWCERSNCIRVCLYLFLYDVVYVFRLRNILLQNDFASY